MHLRNLDQQPPTVVAPEQFVQTLRDLCASFEASLETSGRIRMPFEGANGQHSTAGSRGANEDLAEVVRQAIRFRRFRSETLQELVADPAWDMLLDLFLCELTQQRVAISAVCHASRVPATTALRWLSTLEETKLVRRRPDPLDGRRIFVELTEEGSRKMTKLFRCEPYFT